MILVEENTDIGGHVPGSVPVNSREIFAEGLRIPPMLLERDGRRNDTLLELIERNVRLPRDFFGDLDAQLSACRTAGPNDLAIFALEHQAQLAGARHLEIGRAILVAKGVAANDDRLGPAGDEARDV